MVRRYTTASALALATALAGLAPPPLYAEEDTTRASMRIDTDGAVAIGTDSAGNGAVASLQDQVVLGTSNHLYTAPGVLSGDLFTTGRRTRLALSGSPGLPAHGGDVL